LASFLLLFVLQQAAFAFNALAVTADLVVPANHVMARRDERDRMVRTSRLILARRRTRNLSDSCAAIRRIYSGFQLSATQV